MYKILIAEDDEEIALIEKDYLEMNGYDVHVASDGIAALTEIENDIYDLLLLDVMLPGINGY